MQLEESFESNSLAFSEIIITNILLYRQTFSYTYLVVGSQLFIFLETVSPLDDLFRWQVNTWEIAHISKSTYRS